MPQDQSRRDFLLAIPAVMALAACVRPAKVLEGSWGRFAAEGGRVVDHRGWDDLLARYLVPGADGINRFAYAAAARTDPALLRPYLTMLQSVDPATLARNEQMAFWINLYNAATVDLILQKPSVQSIRDLGPLTLGPWDKKILTINGNQLSLNHIEHGILRPVWKDVRIHYAVNCASLGCPNLATQSYRGDRLEAMLEQAASDFINHPRAFAAKGGKVHASSIYNWYADDWGGVAEILTHARRYARGATAALLATAVTIDGYDYDWKLNAV